MKQPAQHRSGDIVLWNAEIFGGIKVKQYYNYLKGKAMLVNNISGPSCSKLTMSLVNLSLKR